MVKLANLCQKKKDVLHLTYTTNYNCFPLQNRKVKWCKLSTKGSNNWFLQIYYQFTIFFHFSQPWWISCMKLVKRFVTLIKPHCIQLIQNINLMFIRPIYKQEMSYDWIVSKSLIYTHYVLQAVTLKVEGDDLQILDRDNIIFLGLWTVWSI